MSEKIEKHLESIHRELRGTEQDLSRERQKSLKYYDRDIHHRLGEWLSAHALIASISILMKKVPTEVKSHAWLSMRNDRAVLCRCSYEKDSDFA